MTMLIAERKKKYIDMIELTDVNPDDLTEEDAVMWYNVNNYTKGLITQAQLEKYTEGVNHSDNVSRGNFRAVIGNKLMLLWGKEELEKMSSGK